MDDIEITYHGDPPEERKKTLAEQVFTLAYYGWPGCLLVCIFVLTPIVAVIIAFYNG